MKKFKIGDKIEFFEINMPCPTHRHSLCLGDTGAIKFSNDEESSKNPFYKVEFQFNGEKFDLDIYQSEMKAFNKKPLTYNMAFKILKENQNAN